MFNALEAMIKIANELGIYLEGRTGHDKVLRKRHKKRKDANMNKALSSVDYKPSHLEADVKKKDPNGNITYVRFKYFKKPDGNWYKQRADGQGVIRPCSKSEVPLNMATKVGTVNGGINKNDRIPMRISSRVMNKHDEYMSNNKNDYPTDSRYSSHTYGVAHTPHKELYKTFNINMQRSSLQNKNSDAAIQHEIGHHKDIERRENEKNDSFNAASHNEPNFVNKAKSAINQVTCKYGANNISDHNKSSNEIYADQEGKKAVGPSYSNKIKNYANSINKNIINNAYAPEFKSIKDRSKVIKRSNLSKNSKKVQLNKLSDEREGISSRRDTAISQHKLNNNIRKEIIDSIS